jgi:drug/metabolite transporter (DMT)-like permease
MKTSEMTVKASALTFFICVLFGGNAVSIKLSLAGFGTFTAAGIRFGVATLVIILWAWIKKIPLKLSVKQTKQTLILAAIFVIQLSFFYHGLERTTASHGILIANILPFFILVLAHYFIPEERITLKKSFGIFLGFIGVLFLFFDTPDMDYDIRSGDAMVLVAVIFWSISAVFVKRINSEYNFIQITLFPMMFAVPFFFIAGFFWDGQMIIKVDAVIFGAMFYQTIVTASFGFLVWNSLLQRFGATALHSFIFIMPLFGVLLGVLLLNEAVTSNLSVSIVFIVLGVIVANYKRRAIPSY